VERNTHRTTIDGFVYPTFPKLRGRTPKNVGNWVNLTAPSWLKNASATDPDSVPPPAGITTEIVESPKLALERFRSVAVKLERKALSITSLEEGRFAVRQRGRTCYYCMPI
jgi:hypothetical protein